MKKTALTIIGWMVSITLLALLAARLDWHVIGHGLAQARWSFLILAATINIAVVAIKALRWTLIMGPEHRSPFREIFRVTMIGLAGNNVLPVRGGDWLRIYLLGKWRGSSKAMLASITGVDKIFDGLAILALFGVLSFHSTFPEWVKRGTIVISIVSAISLAICAMLLAHHRRFLRNEGKDTGRISRLANALGSGMTVLAKKRMIAATLAISIASCVLQIGTIWCCQQAFGQSLDPWVPAVVFVAINLAIVVPSAPSGVGPFEVAAVLAYTWIGLNAETAFNIALTYHLVQFIPVTAIGAVFYMRELGHGGRRHLGTEVAKSETGN